MSIVWLDNFSDYSFRIDSLSLNELFEEAALGLTMAMADVSLSLVQKERHIGLVAENEDWLLMKWLNELVFLKDEKQFLVKKSAVKISKEKNKFVLRAAISPVLLKDVSSQQKKVDVKAVTWHNFGIKKTKKGFRAIIVLDV